MMIMFLSGFVMGILAMVYFCLGAERAERTAPKDVVGEQAEQWLNQRRGPPL
jgi:hypothetical protein